MRDAVKLSHQDSEFQVSVQSAQGGANALKVLLDDQQHDVEILNQEGPHFVICIGNEILRGASVVQKDQVLVSLAGHTYKFAKVRAGAGAGADGAGTAGHIEAPMTGTVLDVLCKVGDQVEAGAALVVVEAMKMEHRLTVSGPGEVTAVKCAAGDKVDIGQILVELTPAESDS